MNNEPTNVVPFEGPKTKVKLDTTTRFFISFWWTGTDNGVPKQGMECSVVEGPPTGFASPSDIQDLANTLAVTFFKDHKYTDLAVTPVNVTRLPL